MAPKIKKQSTNHLLMIEPAAFFANPETMVTNAYQNDDHADVDDTSAQALAEFRQLRDKLVEQGVIITTAQGLTECPDMVFPNWFFTFSDGRFILCPMLNQNRRDERSPEIIALLNKMYPQLEDWTEYEAFDLPLESTASIVSDRVNKKCYAALSPRTDEGLVRKWAENEDYEVELFHTQSHKEGVPVYHTDCVMWIGSTLAGVCSECIVDDDRQRIVSSLRKNHEVIEFDNNQLQSFCGNALEVVGAGGKKMLVMSERAMTTLTDQQMALCKQHFAKIIYSPLDTLERYGGGSARCMLAELL